MEGQLTYLTKSQLLTSGLVEELLSTVIQTTRLGNLKIESKQLQLVLSMIPSHGTEYSLPFHMEQSRQVEKHCTELGVKLYLLTVWLGDMIVGMNMCIMAEFLQLSFFCDE